MMLLETYTPRNEKADQLAIAKRLRQEAKEHRQRGEALDGYRKENRARVIEQRWKNAS